MMDFVRLKEFTFRLGKDVRSRRGGGSAAADIGLWSPWTRWLPVEATTDRRQDGFM